MKQAKIEGEFLPWRDVLYEGPVPDELSLKALSRLRSQFIIERGWGTPKEVIESFEQRDNALEAFRKYEKVILWFEHDLYDQLQIIQILDWLHQNDTDDVELSIICTDRYLGRLTPNEMTALMEYEQPITQSHLTLANQAWSAFRSGTPEKWHRLLDTDTTVLPFLEGAIVRLLEEYPDCSNGLSRTAEQALKVISSGETRSGRIFGRVQQTEQRVFIGDSSFWDILNELLESQPPLIATSDGKSLTLPPSKAQELSITTAGLEVLAGDINWLDISHIDRWIGGVHLTPMNAWCWNSDAGSITKRL